MKIYRLFIALLSLTVIYAGIMGVSIAQDVVNPGGAQQEPAPASVPEDPTNIPSLLFTRWEHEALMDMKAEAKRRGGVRRNVTETELDRAMDETEEVKPKPPPEQRELRLGGILYTTADDWTVWLNEQRVTPNAIPKEVISLRVHRHYIDVKWYDDYTSRIFPIRLRAHQRFNLDSRIFLPG